MKIDEIKNALKRNIYKNEHNNKKYFIATDIAVALELDINLFFNSTKMVEDKLRKISYPIKSMYHDFYDTIDEHMDIQISYEGLVFALGEYWKNCEDKTERETAHKAALIMKSLVKPYYQSRIDARKIYSTTTKYFRSLIKKAVENERYSNLSAQLSNVYSTIICSYYNVGYREDVQIQKIGADKNYLDFISTKELADLSTIQSYILDEVDKNPKTNFIKLAAKKARELRSAFILKYGETPLRYNSHNNTPTKMKNEITKLLKEYKLDDENIKNENEIETLK